MTTTLYLVRHGAAEPTGSDPGLSSSGRAQAALVGDRLASVDFTTVLHSPKRRAAESGRIMFEHGVEPEADPSLSLDDRTPFPADLAEVPAKYHERLHGVPRGERDLGATRLRETVRELGAVGPDERTVLAVTHAFVIGWFVRHALDAPEWRWIGLNPANCSLTVMQFHSTGDHRLISYNDTTHLDR